MMGMTYFLIGCLIGGAVGFITACFVREADDNKHY